MKSKNSLVLLILISLLILPAMADAEDQIINSTRDYSLKLELKHSINKGVKWIIQNQHEDGFWSDQDHPALTGFALFALLNQPGESNNAAKSITSSKYSKQIESGLKYILSKVQPDGGIYTPGQGLANYNTSLSIMALTAANNPAFSDTIRKARRFVIKGQFDFGEKGEVDTTLDGGVGYGNSYPHSDMSNTLLALEALRYSQAYKEEESIIGENELNWDAAIQFITKCQNLSETNPAEWVSDDPENKGGFVYFPGNTKSDTVKLSDGRVALRSYGSISYAGLLSLAYAELDKSDQRVAAVMQWLSENYTLDENPGMGQQGLFYYFHTMAKALSASHTRELVTRDNKNVNWKKQLGLKLMDLQHLDGYWVNPTSRWWEKDPVLVTSYSLIALEIIERTL